MTKQHAPATERNRDAIREVLARELPAAGVVLEIASGSGEHAMYFARAFPGVTWQPSDPDPVARASIAAWRADGGPDNLLAPLALDVMLPWPIAIADAIVCINMIHISPWEATVALFAGAARLGAPLLVTYGPYRFDGVTAASNEQFERSLRGRDPRWGVREVRDLEAVAAEHGLTLRHAIAMPANNHSLVWRRA